MFILLFKIGDNNMNKRYLTDEEIELTYLNICEPETTFKINFKESGDSGWIQMKLPQNEERNRVITQKDDYEDYDLLDEERLDSFIIYNNGQIAFDLWYPEKVYNHIVKNIINKFKDESKTESQKNALKRYAEINEKRLGRS